MDVRPLYRGTHQECYFAARQLSEAVLDLMTIVTGSIPPRMHNIRMEFWRCINVYHLCTCVHPPRAIPRNLRRTLARALVRTLSRTLARSPPRAHIHVRRGALSLRVGYLLTVPPPPIPSPGQVSAAPFSHPGPSPT
jgi:hypothetical protein